MHSRGTSGLGEMFGSPLGKEQEPSIEFRFEQYQLENVAPLFRVQQRLKAMLGCPLS